MTSNSEYDGNWENKRGSSYEKHLNTVIITIPSHPHRLL